MIRSLTALGLTVIAVLALSAVGAASANAQAAHLTAGSNSGAIKITQHPSSTIVGIQFFETSSGTIECHEFDAEIDYAGGSGGTTKITEETFENVEWNECLLGGLEAEVDFGTCDYHLSQVEWVNPPGHPRSDVELGPAGCEVTITDLILGCEVTIEGLQTFEDAFTFTDVKTGTKEELIIHINASELEYEAGALCPDPGVFGDGVYEGTLTAKAFDTGSNQVNLTSPAAAPPPSGHITAGANSGKVKITQHSGSTLGGIQFLETSSGMAECHKFSAESSYAGGSEGSTKITASTVENIKYEECFFGGLESTIGMGACDYTLSGVEWVSSPGHARSDLNLGSAGCKITINELVTGCVVTVEGSQFFEDAFTYTKVKTTTKEELTIHANASKVKYTAGANCPNPGSFTDGVYEGTLTAKAFNTINEPVDLTGVAT